MHAAELMARLNPTTVRYDIGRGGIPSLTAQDIAAALAFVDEGLGRELLLRTWWPAGAKLTQDRLHEIVDRVLRTEWGRRETVMTEALMAVIDHGPRAQRQYQDALQQRWPELTTRKNDLEPVVADGWRQVRDGVLAEVGSAGLCHACSGRGTVANDHGVHTSCATCAGVGHHRMGERERAYAAGFKWTTYRDSWASVYDWLFQHCAEALHRAERQFGRALSD